jgi:hypothetical protein
MESRRLGVGEYYPLLAAMLTNRPWADILHAAADPTALQATGTDADQEQIRSYASQCTRRALSHHGSATRELVPALMTAGTFG